MGMQGEQNDMMPEAPCLLIPCACVQGCPEEKAEREGLCAPRPKSSIVSQKRCPLEIQQVAESMIKCLAGAEMNQALHNQNDTTVQAGQQLSGQLPAQGATPWAPVLRGDEDSED